MSHPRGSEKGSAGDAEEHVKAAPANTAADSTPKPPTQPEVEDVSDPDEDDLDDLDDMLDDFSAIKVDPKKASPAVPKVAADAKADTATKDAGPESKPSLEDDFSEEEFAKQLQAGMADLLGELDKSPDIQAQFEGMFKQMAGAAAATDGAKPDAAGSASESKDTSSPAAGGEASFQETIRRTMERMQNSGDQATAAASSGGEDDFMSELLKQLSSGDLNAEGSEEDFSKMLMGMMDQLTNKEILYEPMKELSDKFPEWLEKNKATTSAEDLKRYEEQKTLATEIVAKFEESSYSDSNAKDREYIVDRMQKMQAAGSPPSDLVGDMPSAQDAFNMPDEQCNPQ